MIDQNRDGFVDKDDLIEMMTSLGKNPTDELVDAMVQEASGPINFTMFLTLFGDKLSGTDPEDVIVNAFACFDEKHTGFFMFHSADMSAYRPNVFIRLFYSIPGKPICRIRV